MAAITYTIPNIHVLNQLQEPSNPRMDCAFCADAELLNAYLGTHYTGSQIKAEDNDYGPAYTGGAAERYLTDTMARHGVVMTRMASSTQAGLVSILHSELAKGHGVIVTIPSQWNSAVTKAGAKWNPRTYSGPSHVVLMCGYGPGVLRAANSWPLSGTASGSGFLQDATDYWWQQRLLEGEVWVGVLSSTAKVTSMIPSGWHDDATKGVLTAPNGVAVVRGFREYVLAASAWDATNTPRAVEYIGADGHSRQDFRFSALQWLNNTASLAPIGDELATAQAQIAALQAQLAAAQHQPAPVADPLKDKALDILTQLTAFQKAL